MLEIIFALLFLLLRILLIGSERIFLTKNKLGKYDSITIASLFFLFATILLLPGLLLVPFTAYTAQSLLELRFSALSSIFYSIGFYTYVKALSEEDASLIAPLYNSSLLWLFILSALFLQDNITVIRVAGALMMFIGFFFLYSGSFKEKIKTIKSSKGSLLMIFGSLFLAVGRTIDAYAIANANEILYAISMNFFVGFYLFIIVLLGKKFNVVKEVIIYDKKNIFYASLANGWAYLFLLLAIMGLQVTIAEPASLLSIFVTALLAKKFLGEEIKERIPGSIIIILGSLLLLIEKILQ